MSIRDKIFRSNILMVSISLLVLLIVIVASTNFFLKDKNSTDYSSNINNNTQNIIYIFEHNLIYSDFFETCGNTCNNYGYSLIIESNDEIVYAHSSANLNTFKNLNLPDKNNVIRNTVVYNMPTVTVVAKNIDINGISYNAYAIGPINSVNKGISFKEILPFVFFIGCFTILLLLVVSHFSTKNLVEKIMIPINSLNQAAKRISINNMDIPVKYTGEKEFEKVCATFNEMQESIKENRMKMIAYEESRTDMVTGISHDLRTPLTSVRGYVKGILDGIADTPQKQKEYLEIIYSTTEEMNVLLDKLFIFSKVETGNMPFHFINFNIGEYIEKYVAEHENILSLKNVKIKSHIPPRLSDNMFDIDQIKRVLDNLVENSIKYACNDDTAIDIYLSETDKSQIITFGDNGCGVAPEKLPLIFTRFYRCDEARTAEGNGVGLYVVKYIVEAHKGKIKAINDNGLKIIMEFPKGDVQL